LRIAVCAEHVSAEAGGAELAVSRYIEGMIRAGQDLTICTTRRTCKESVAWLSSLGADVIQFPSNAMDARQTGRYTQELARIFRANDAIYIAKGWYSIAQIANSEGKPVVAHSHDYHLVCPHGDLAFEKSSLTPSHIPCSPCQLLRCNIGSSKTFAVEGLLTPPRAVVSVLLSPLKTIDNFLSWGDIFKSLSCIDHLVLVSEYSRQLLTSHIPSLTGHCSVIYNPAIDLGYVRPSESPVLRLGYFGGASYLKGYTFLLRSLRSIKDHLSRSQIELVAPGTQDTDFSKLVRRLKLESWVRELPRLSRNEIPSLYKDLDAIVVPSVSPEPLPYVAQEAQLFGRPVLASNTGGLPEIVEHEKTGWLFRSADQMALTTLLRQVLMIPKNGLRYIGLRARVCSRSRFVETDPIRKLISIFQTSGRRGISEIEVTKTNL